MICCNLQTASTYICCSASKSIADDYLVLTQIIPREYNVHFFVSSVFVVLNISIDVLLSIMLVLVLSEAASSHIIIIKLNICNNSRVRTQLLITFIDSESKKKLYGSLHRGASLCNWLNPNYAFYGKVYTVYFSFSQLLDR